MVTWAGKNLSASHRSKFRVGRKKSNEKCLNYRVEVRNLQSFLPPNFIPELIESRQARNFVEQEAEQPETKLKKLWEEGEQNLRRIVISGLAIG